MSAKRVSSVIVSNGLDFYIKKILEDMGLCNLEYHAAETRFHANKLKVRYIGPEGSVIDSGYKEQYVNKYLNDGYHVVYIGNGSSDLSPARGAIKYLPLKVCWNTVNVPA